MDNLTTDTRVVVTGGNGFLGKSVLKHLKKQGINHNNIFAPSSNDFDLTSEKDVKNLYKEYKPNIIIHLAAEVGGIGAISENPGRFFYANTIMGLYLVEYGREYGIDKLVFVGSGCSYPKYCNIPFNEQDLWNGFPDDNVAPYAIAKKSLIVLLKAYHKQYGLQSSIVIPTNLYGPADHFYSKGSHVVPALITKIHKAKINNEDHINCWGTGDATRDFLYVDDAAKGILASMVRINNPTPINLGSGQEISITDITHKIMNLFNYSGKIIWDTNKPEGQPRRLLDINKANLLLNWQPTTNIEQGLIKTIEWFHNNYTENETYHAE